MKISKLIKFYFFPSGLVVAWFFGHLMLLLLSILKMHLSANRTLPKRK